MTTGKITFFPALDQQITEFRQALSRPASDDPFSRSSAQQSKPKLSPYTRGFLAGVAMGAGVAFLPEGALVLLLPGAVMSVAVAYSALQAALASEAAGRRLGRNDVSDQDVLHARIEGCERLSRPA